MVSASELEDRLTTAGFSTVEVFLDHEKIGVLRHFGSPAGGGRVSYTQTKAKKGYRGRFAGSVDGREFKVGVEAATVKAAVRKISKEISIQLKWEQSPEDDQRAPSSHFIKR